MPDQFSPEHRNRTLLFLILSVICAASAVLIGIDDNPVGIALVLLSAAGLVLAVVHPWRSSARFRQLTLGAVAAFFGSLAAGIALSVPPDLAKLPVLLEDVMRIAGTALLLAASFLCIPAFIIGLAGLLIQRRRGLQA